MDIKMQDFVSLKEYLQEKFGEIKHHMSLQDDKIKELEQTFLTTAENLSDKIELLEKRLEYKIQCQAEKWIAFETEKKVKNKFLTVIITILGAISGFLGGILAKGG